MSNQMPYLIDSHAHLDDRKFDADREQVMQRAREAGVINVVNVGFDMDSSRRAVGLAAKYRDIFAAVGVHPHDAADVAPDYLGVLRDLSRCTRVVALGEMGLDYYRDLSPRPVQQEVFRAQLALARERNLPVIIHDRDAHGDVLDILRRDGLGPAGGVMHCFSGSWEFARECMALGLFISLAGPVTYPNARKLKEVAVKAPLDRLLVETDCPYLAPQEHRGKRNEPGHVRYVAQHIAFLREMDVRDLAAATTANTKRVFNLF